MTIDRQSFFTGVRRLFAGGLKQPQVVGMSAILDEWDQRLPNGDLRWLAYMLATTFHETNQQMLPVREAYWMSEDWRRRNLRYYPYYGRGFVQLTWPANYAKAGAYVRADLVRNPDLALRPDYAAAIMFVGMGEGWFRADQQGRRHTLTRYFNARTNDPVGARAIINGREIRKGVLIAAVIARYHAAFLGALGARAAAPPAFDLSAAATALPLAETAFASLADASADRETAPEFWTGIEGDAMPVEALPQENEAARRRMELVAQIVTGFVAANSLAPSELPSLMRSVYSTLEDMDSPAVLDRIEPGIGSGEEADSIDLMGESPEERAAAPIVIVPEAPPLPPARGRRRGSSEGDPTPQARERAGEGVSPIPAA